MRLVQNYVFYIGTKIPYSEWPDIVHRFLEENRLTSHRFLYFFESLLYNGGPSPEKCGCAKIRKDCPALGEIRFRKGEPRGRSDAVWLSNIDKNDNFSEENILPLMTKIHRRYGISENVLYYYDIDFFGHRTYFGRRGDRLYGSGIELYRDVCGANYLLLSVDILHDGSVLDATPYAESMKRLLPKIRCSTSLDIYLTEEEEQRIAAIDRSAEPVLEQCREYLSRELPLAKDQNRFSSQYSVAKPLKALAKRYGYTYRLVWNGGAYALEKRTDRGNVLSIEAECGPSRYHLGICVTYQGVGFNHHLIGGAQTPTNQQEADAFLGKVLSVVSAFETDLLPSLDVLYPETPDWFVAKH